MNLFVLEQVPAWFTNRLQRLIKTPKRYLVDAALATTSLRLTPKPCYETATCSAAYWTRSS